MPNNENKSSETQARHQSNVDHTRRISRRELLKSALVNSAVTIVGCGILGSAFGFLAENQPPSEDIYEEEAPLIKNPYLRAASALIIAKNKKGDAGMGHGGVFQNSSGELLLMTVFHVIEGKTEYELLVPGVNNNKKQKTQLQWQKFPHAQSVNDNSYHDSIVFAYPDENLRKQLRQAITNGAIKPLIISSFTDNLETQKYGYSEPDINELGNVYSPSYSETNNQISFSRTNVTLCPGYSGSPILELDQNGRPTGKAIGLITEGTAINTPYFGLCLPFGDLRGIPFPTRR